VAEDRLADEEVVFRRIPPTTPWFEPPDRISTANFKLNVRENELGLSVYRQAVVSAAEVLAKPDAIADSLVVRCTIGQIRGLKNGKGESLQLNVIRVDDDQNPGHAEIRGPIPGKLTDAATKRLRDAFHSIE
jgi:hypothetical protein